MSKLKFIYDTLEDSQAKLQGTVILYDKEPAYVLSVQGLNTDQQAELTMLPTVPGANSIKAPITDEHLEVRNLPLLGYVNYGAGSFYLSRKPARQWRQGLHRSNVHIPSIEGCNTPNFDRLLVHKSFTDMLKGVYSKFSDVFDEIIVSEEFKKKAFSKTMALSIDDMESVVLWNRGYKVAIANNPKKYGPVFKLPTKFKYLQEELQENGIKVD